MNCKKCGFVITNQDKVCPNCGEPNELYVEQVAPVESEPLPVTEAAPAAPVEPVAPVTPVEPAQPVVQPAAPAAPTATINPAPAQPVVAEPKKSNAAFIIVVIILGIIIVGLGIFIGIKLLGGNKGTDTPTPSTPSTPSTPTVDPTPTSDPTTPADNSTTVQIDDYTFTLPSSFQVAQTSTGDYAIGNSNFFFRAKDTAIAAVTYDQLLAKKDTITSTFKKEYEQYSNVTYIETVEETYSGKKYLVVRFKYTDGGETYAYDAVFTSLPDGNAFETIVDYYPTYQTSGYKLFTDFINSGKTNSQSFVSEMPTLTGTPDSSLRSLFK